LGALYALSDRAIPSAVRVPNMRCAPARVYRSRGPVAGDWIKSCDVRRKGWELCPAFQCQHYYTGACACACTPRRDETRLEGVWAGMENPRARTQKEASSFLFPKIHLRANRSISVAFFLLAPHHTGRNLAQTRVLSWCRGQPTT
jgi:hypothetical protein